MHARSLQFVPALRVPLQIFAHVGCPIFGVVAAVVQVPLVQDAFFVQHLFETVSGFHFRVEAPDIQVQARGAARRDLIQPFRQGFQIVLEGGQAVGADRGEQLPVLQP